MNLQEGLLILGILSCLLPVVAVLMRRTIPLLRLATVLLALAMSGFLFSLLRLLQVGPTSTPHIWVYALMGSCVPVLLAGYLLSLCIGRERPEDAFRNSRRSFVLLGFGAVVALLLVRRASFVTGFDWNDGRGTIHIGSLGKAFLSYLLVGVVATGYNLESTYRLVSSNVRPRLKLLFLAFFGFLGFVTFVVTTGLLYSALGVGKLVAAVLPIILANVLLGYSFIRSSLSDVAAPVSRSIVYSSFTAIAAGLYVLAVGVISQVATYTNWSPDEVVILSFGFLAVLLAVLLLFSNRFQRRVRRFIDRNFYVNRYDYRTQWSNVTSALESGISKEGVLRAAHDLLRDVFLADAVTISLHEEASLAIRPRLGKGSDDGVRLEVNAPLAVRLAAEKRALLLNRRPDDFEYIAIYAENSGWLDTTASQIVAPLLEGGRLMGCVGLERLHKDDPFTYEDVALLDSVASHIASKLREAQHAEELAESREMSLMSQWSNMLLHDLKNYLSPLRLVAQNLVQHKDTPGFAEMAAGDLGRVADRMESLVRALSELRDKPRGAQQRIDVNEIVRTTVREMQVERRDSLQVELQLGAPATVTGDQDMLQRVIENLVTNAIEAMDGAGKLRIATQSLPLQATGSRVHVSVQDTGVGMPPEFVRDRLFRPFATTKKGGLGLGLYQCRSIVRAHGGELKVESEPGVGTTVEIIMTGTPDQNAAAEAELASRTPGGIAV
jgi:hypothetical protein